MAKILKNEGSFKILSIMAGLNGESPLQLMETAGRTAYQSRDKITDESSVKFVEMLRKRGHESVLEHSCMTIEFNNLSRGFTHELVRHRLVAYTQESTRYVDESDFKVVMPPDRDKDQKVVKLVLPDGKESEVSFQEWNDLNEQMYKGLRKAGWLAQDARQILPTGITAQIVATANFREWRHILKLRCDPAAHWEIRQVMVELLKDCQKRIPVVFDDFEISADGTSAAIKKTI
jgi:thymidylate synthase (FAD)